MTQPINNRVDLPPFPKTYSMPYIIIGFMPGITFLFLTIYFAWVL